MSLKICKVKVEGDGGGISDSFSAYFFWATSATPPFACVCRNSVISPCGFFIQK